MSPPILHHVNLKTLRMDELIEWYGTVVGMRVHHKFPGGAWLSNDGANHRLALLTSSRLSEPQDKLLQTGMHHLAFEFASLHEMFDEYERLRDRGILPHAALDHGMTISLYYVDRTATASSCRPTRTATGRARASSSAPPRSSRRTDRQVVQPGPGAQGAA